MSPAHTDKIILIFCEYKNLSKENNSTIICEILNHSERFRYTNQTNRNNIPIDLRNKSFLAFCPTYKKYLLDQVVL